MLTWGQIRLNLQTGAQGLSLDLLDEWMNSRYSAILDHYDWSGLEVEAVLQTMTVQNATVNVTNGATQLVGSGSAWSAALNGCKLTIDGRIVYTIVDASVPAEIVLDRPFEGTTATGAAAQIFQNEYQLPSACKRIISMTNPYWGGMPMTEWSSVKMDAESIGAVRWGEPAYFAPSADTPSAPVLHRVAIWPIPLMLHGLPYRYELSAIPFDGTNTDQGPLPWVQDFTLMNGVRADIAAYLEKPAMVQMYEAKFVSGLAEMVRLDAKRKGPETLQMADRYTRHRVERVLRRYTRRIC